MKLSPVALLLVGVAIAIGVPAMLANLIGILSTALNMAPEPKTQDPIAALAGALKDVYTYFLNALRDPVVVAVLLALSAVSLAAVNAVR